MPKADAVKTVKRAIDILNILAEANGQVGVIELSKRLKTSQSTVYRILSTLVGECYTVQNPRTEKYAVGLQGIILAGAALNQLEIRKQAIEVLQCRVGRTRLALAHASILLCFCRWRAVSGPSKPCR